MQSLFEDLKSVKKHLCNCLQDLQGTSRPIQTVFIFVAFLSPLTGPVSVALVTEKCNIFCFLWDWGNWGRPDLPLQLKGAQIIVIWIRAKHSSSLVYWSMAPSCMAQASFCVLLRCMPRSAHKFKGRDFWLDTTFSRLLSDSPRILERWHNRCHSFAGDTFSPRNRGVEPQLPIGSVAAPGSNTKSGLEGYGGEPGHRITDTDRK